MATLSRQELEAHDKPWIINYIRDTLKLTGYSGLNKPELIEYALHPPPKESQRSPGRPKGLGGTKVVTSQGAGSSEVKPWDTATLNSINLADLKRMLVSLGVKGYSGKPKGEVVAKLLSLVPPAGFSIQVEGKTITFNTGTRTGSSPPRPSIMSSDIMPVTTKVPLITSITVNLPKPVLAPTTKKVQQLPYEPHQEMQFEIQGKTYDIVQPAVGSIVYNNNDSKTYVVIEIGKDPQLGYTNKIVLVPATKLDKSTPIPTVFYFEDSPKVVMYLTFSEVIGWVTESGSTLNLTWGSTNV